ncbi:DUF3261 domain-containing protein [Colwellia sp. E2M01]|uniref:DUF3261 domain-containing protein n=1 Tax=Colwellia sp. E2M01 TaxID=2841561 RepID=UPI001C0A24AD|nr:DUF3261 domain-containing protein [Colwellia sp. E2M01]MBU2871626.1 DUF3261 domain-containing protein [Colwellia sp. E2M01]
MSLLISACSLIKNDQAVTDFYQLQPLPYALKNKTYLESLTFEQKDKRTLLTQIETQEHTLSLGAMTYSGLPIMQAKWESNKGLIGFSSAVFDESMVLRIIRDIQLIKWPDSDVSNGLLAGYQVTTTQKNSVEGVREITQLGETVISITYTKQKIVLSNITEQYQLTIEQVNE